MKLSGFLKVSSVCLIACWSLQADTVTLSPIYVSIGPNANAPSPSYPGYTTNAQAGVTAGGTNVGGNIATTPTAYNVVGSGTTATVPIGDIIGTNAYFPSWLSVAPPTLASLAGETGNMLFWSVVITGQAGLNDISLANLGVSQYSTDPLGSFGTSGSPYAGNFASLNYSADNVGILANGTPVTSGSSSQMVNEIVLTSFGAFLDPGQLAADEGLTYTGTSTQQMAEMNAAFDQYLGNFAIDTCFTYGAASTCDTVNVIVPEPVSLGSVTLALVMLPAFWMWRRFRRA